MEVEKKLETKVLAVLTDANILTIKNHNDCLAVVEFTKTVRALQREVKDTFDPIVEKAHAAHKEAVTQRKKHLEPLQKAENIANSKRLSYEQEQRRLREAEEAKLRARAAAEEEKKRKALEARAKTAEEKGNTEKAETLREQKEEVSVIAPVLPEDDNKPQTRVTWKHRIIDANKVPREFMMVDEAKLRGIARATKGSLHIPGVEFYSDESIVNRGF